ncbi:MAG: four helix bundle protein [candidate division WOR-3 bacterium]|nr:MAG: four helix bundle protein [candidate division WOR-3 bacterium]
MRKKIASFRDWEVYRRSDKAAIIAIKQIIPKLLREEKYDLTDQLRGLANAVPRLIAEGYSRRHQPKGFQKYLDDTLGESNETIVSLSQVRDIYGVEKDLRNKMIGEYETISRNTYRLALVWDSLAREKDKSASEVKRPNPNLETIS